MKKVICLALVFSLLVTFALAVTTIKVSGWPGNPTEEGAIKRGIDAFNNSQSNIQVVWEPIPGDYRQMLQTQLSAGTAPDIFYVDVYWFEELARKNVLLALDLYIRREGFDTSDFYDSLLGAFTSNSRLYGLPKDFSTLSLYYNKEIFDKYQIPYPTDCDTWEDFTRKAMLLKEKGFETPLVLAADFNRVIPVILSWGGQLVDEKLGTALNLPKSKAGLQFYIDLVTKYNVAKEPNSVGGTWIGEAYGKEAVAMAMSGPWSIGYLKEQFPQTWNKTGIVQLPTGEAKSTMIYTVCYSINRNTKDKDAAWEVLKFLTKEAQQIFVDDAGVLGSRKSIAENDTASYKQPFYKGAEYGHPWKVETPSGIFSQAEAQLNSLLRDLFYEKINVDGALKYIVDNYNSWVSSK